MSYDDLNDDPDFNPDGTPVEPDEPQHWPVPYLAWGLGTLIVGGLVGAVAIPLLLRASRLLRKAG